MAIETQQRATYLGLTGVSITTVTLLTREAFMQGREGAMTGGKAMSFNELLSEGSVDLIVPNPHTGDEVRFSPEELRAAFAGSDLDNSFLQIQVKFVPDRIPENIRYPSDMVEELRQGGMPEEEIQKLLEAERLSRSSSG